MLLFFITLLIASKANYEHAKVFGTTEGQGYYYVDIWVGTPPKRQTVIIDTGSRLTAFPCIGCPECGKHLDSYFDYKNSSTSRAVSCKENIPCSSCDNDSCGYYQGYTEGSSISGILVQDLVMFGDNFNESHRVYAIFGCHRKETHLFKTQLADGIMGFGRSKDIPTLVDVLYKNHDIDTNIFAICFGKIDGFMTIGGYNSTMHTGNVNWTGSYGNMFYSVKAKALSVDFKDTGLVSSDFSTFYDTGTIIDSGTTFTYLGGRVYDQFFSKFEEFCDQSKKNCDGQRKDVAGEPHKCFYYNKSLYSNKQDFFFTFPIVSFLMDEVFIDWKPEFYLFAWPETPDYYCVGVYLNSAGNVLGGNFMRGMDVIFDRSLNKIGFAPSSCDPSYIIATEVPYYNDTLVVPNVLKSDSKVPWAFVLGMVVCFIVVSALIVRIWIKSKNPASLQFQQVEEL